MDTYLTADKMVSTYCKYDSIEKMDEVKFPYLKGIVRAMGELTLISAPPKAGKTMLMLQLALCMATGHEWLDFKPRPKNYAVDDGECYDVTVNGVLYVNLETNEELLAYHLQAMCKAMGLKKPPENLRIINLNEKEIADKRVKQGIDDYILNSGWIDNYRMDGESDSEFLKRVYRKSSITVYDDPSLSRYSILENEGEYDIIDYLENRNAGGKLRPKDIILFLEKTLQLMDCDRPCVDTVIIDPFYLLYHGDENDIVQVCDCLESIKEKLTYNDDLCRIDRNIFLVHHHSKGNKASIKSIDRSSGSNVFSRYCETIIDLIELDTTKEANAGKRRGFSVDIVSRDYPSINGYRVWSDYPLFTPASGDELKTAGTKKTYNKEKVSKKTAEEKKADNVKTFESKFDALQSHGKVKSVDMRKAYDVKTDRTISRYIESVNQSVGYDRFTRENGYILRHEKK